MEFDETESKEGGYVEPDLFSILIMFEDDFVERVRVDWVEINMFEMKVS